MKNEYSRKDLIVAYNKETEKIYKVDDIKPDGDCVIFNCNDSEYKWSGYNLSNDKFILMKNTGFADTTGNFLFENDIVRMKNKLYLVRFKKNTINEIVFVNIDKELINVNFPISTKYIIVDPSNVYQGNLFGNKEFLIKFFEDTPYNYRIDFAERIGLSEGEIDQINKIINNNYLTIPAIEGAELPSNDYKYECPVCGNILDIIKVECCGIKYNITTKTYISSVNSTNKILNDIRVENNKKEDGEKFEICNPLDNRFEEYPNNSKIESNSYKPEGDLPKDSIFDKKFIDDAVEYIENNYKNRNKETSNDFCVYGDTLYTDITNMKYRDLTTAQKKELSLALFEASKILVDKKYKVPYRSKTFCGPSFIGIAGKEESSDDSLCKSEGDLPKDSIFDKKFIDDAVEYIEYVYKNKPENETKFYIYEDKLYESITHKKYSDLTEIQVSELLVAISKILEILQNKKYKVVNIDIAANNSFIQILGKEESSDKKIISESSTSRAEEKIKDLLKNKSEYQETLVKDMIVAINKSKKLFKDRSNMGFTISLNCILANLTLLHIDFNAEQIKIIENIIRCASDELSSIHKYNYTIDNTNHESYIIFTPSLSRMIYDNDSVQEILKTIDDYFKDATVFSIDKSKKIYETKLDICHLVEEIIKNYDIDHFKQYVDLPMGKSSGLYNIYMDCIEKILEPIIACNIDYEDNDVEFIAQYENVTNNK